MNRRNIVGAPLVIVGVGFASFALRALIGDNRNPPIFLGVVAAVLALVTLGTAWTFMSDAGTPQARTEVAPKFRAKGPRPSTTAESAE